MSPDGRAVIVKRTKLFTVIPGLLSLVAACSSSGLTCGDGDMSKDCLASSDRRAGEMTGSIQMQPVASGDPTEIAPLQIVRPQVVRSAQRVQQPNTALARRQVLSHKSVREVRLGRLATCDVTGLPPRDDVRSSATNRRLGGGVAHAVIPGETLYSIARRCGTSVAEVASFNIIERPAPIKSNATIMIPVPNTTPPV